ncbi:protein MIZU-KUSSEI 1-like [Silene latifolia]|uniref:protein MIZU-KUSSEI 1-like n=1 Tax=Silene latifolia TaxID=37657 RepID=UPI003D7715C7
MGNSNKLDKLKINTSKKLTKSPSTSTSSPVASRINSSLVPPSPKKNKEPHKKPKAIRVLRSVIRSFPIITPKPCHFPGGLPTRSSSSGNRVTGTMFGYKKGKVNFSLQETTKSLPTLVLELPIQTNTLQKEMSLGMVRIALECEKRPEKDKSILLDEPIWTMFCNGKKFGYAVKREANEVDLNVMELLKVITMGIGVLPASEFSEGEDPEDELPYVRAHFEHVVGSRDSETLYMICPDGNNVPELSIFFVRI